MTSLRNGDSQLDYAKDLIRNIRSDDEQEQAKTISQIPAIILRSIEGDEVFNQVLLVIHNLNSDDQVESLTLGNRTIVFRNLLRLFTENDGNHKDQVDALIRLIYHASSELLIELSYALHRCGNDSRIDEALNAIKDKACENLYSDTLLMIYSIMELRQQQQQQAQQPNLAQDSQ